LHFAVAPVGSVLPAVFGAVVVGAVAFEAVPLVGTLDGGGVAAGAGPEDEPLPDPAAAFFTPPWPLHAPRPVAVEVVPSVQVVGAVAEACASAVRTAKPQARKINDGTIMRARAMVFIGFAPPYEQGCRVTA
jgi:hypothetical protein